MGKWLDQLKNLKTAPEGTDRTDKTSAGEVLSVLSVPFRTVLEKFTQSEEGDMDGFVSSVSASPEHLRNFSAKKLENAPEANRQNPQNPHCDRCQQIGETLEVSRSGFDASVHRWCLDDWERDYDERWPQ